MSTVDGDSELQARRTRRRSKPSRGDQQEQVILDAFVELLHEHRFAELTVAKVAAAVGMSRPAVYFYFGSMEELLVAVIGRGLSELMDSIESVDIKPDATPMDVLVVGLERTAEGWRSHGDLLGTAIEHAHAIPAVYAQWRMLLDRGVDLYVALMTWAADLAGKPAPDEDEARRYAELCMLMVGNAFHQSYIAGQDPKSEQRLKQDLLTLVSRSLELQE